MESAGKRMRGRKGDEEEDTEGGSSEEEEGGKQMECDFKHKEKMVSSKRRGESGTQYSTHDDAEGDNGEESGDGVEEEETEDTDDQSAGDETANASSMERIDTGAPSTPVPSNHHQPYSALSSLKRMDRIILTKPSRGHGRCTATLRKLIGAHMLQPSNTALYCDINVSEVCAWRV